MLLLQGKHTELKKTHRHSPTHIRTCFKANNLGCAGFFKHYISALMCGTVCYFVWKEILKYSIYKSR